MARALQPRVYFPSIEDFRREIEDIFSRSLERTGPQKARSVFPPIETSCDGNEYVMRVDLPGIDPKEIELTLNGDVVTLRGSREHHDKQESWDIIYCERCRPDLGGHRANPRASPRSRRQRVASVAGPACCTFA